MRNNRKINKKNSVFSLLIVLFAILLNQSNVMFGVNISFSDILIMLILVSLIFSKRLSIPHVPLMFFIFISISVIFTASVIAPEKYNYYYDISSIMKNWIKLLVSFLYLVIGYNFVKTNNLNNLYKYYSFAALVIGLVGIIFSISKIRLFNDLLFYGGVRFRGFMNDPNYFSIVMVTAFVYFYRLSSISKIKKVSISFLVLLSIIVSGSKTGMLVFILYIVFISAEYQLRTSISMKGAIRKSFLFLATMLMMPALIKIYQRSIEKLTLIFPIFNRINMLTNNFNLSLNAEGSGRGLAWYTAGEIIKDSPITGIGIGSYSRISYLISGSNVIAHNTYLQLFAEWGIPLTIVYLVYLLLILIKSSSKKLRKAKVNLASRDIIIILLFGSMSISLNNVRILWLSLGSLIYLTKFHMDSMPDKL